MLALQGNDRPLADASILPVDNRINLGYVKIVISEKNKFDVQYEDPAVRHDLLKQIENGEDNSEEMVNSMEVREEYCDLTAQSDTDDGFSQPRLHQRIASGSRCPSTI